MVNRAHCDRAGNPLAYRLPTLKFSWTWYDDEVRALGGQPLTAWHVYRSGDGVQWDAATELAASARNASYDCEVAQVGRAATQVDEASLVF